MASLEALPLPDLAPLSLDDGSERPRPQPPSLASAPITFRRYEGEQDIPHIMNLVESELSEPYNYYTYRYFLSDWPNLCFFAYAGDLPIGTVVCKQEPHKNKLNRGYLAMLSTRANYRGRGVATHLVRLAITEMISNGCQEIVLETETDNLTALRFYRRMGFIKDKRMFRFYLNAKDAMRLKLPLGAIDGFHRERAKKQAEAGLSLVS